MFKTTKFDDAEFLYFTCAFRWNDFSLGFTLDL